MRLDPDGRTRFSLFCLLCGTEGYSSPYRLPLDYSEETVCDGAPGYCQECERSGAAERSRRRMADIVAAAK